VECARRQRLFSNLKRPLVMWLGLRVAPLAVLSRQAEGHEGVPDRGSNVASSTGCDHDKLAPINHVGAGRGIAAGRKRILPQDLARPLVESVELFVSTGSDENESDAGDDTFPEIQGSRGWNSTCCELRILSQRHLSPKLSLVEVDGHQHPPGRVVGWITLIIAEEWRGDALVGVDLPGLRLAQGQDV